MAATVALAVEGGMTVSDERLAELLCWVGDGNSPLSRDDDQAMVSALQDLTARRAAERAPRTPLREAMEAAFAKLVDAPTVGNDEYNRLSETCQSALDALAEAEGLLQAALAAPAPGREELERKLRELKRHGFSKGVAVELGGSEAAAKADGLAEAALAELLALWEARHG